MPVEMGAICEEPEFTSRILVTMEQRGGEFSADAIFSKDAAANRDRNILKTAWKKIKIILQKLLNVIIFWRPRNPARFHTVKSVKNNLREYIRVYHNTKRSAGGGYGPSYRLLATPFLHFVYNNEAKSGTMALAGPLKERFDGHFGEQAMDDCRFSPLAADNYLDGSRIVRVQFGYGVYIPGGNERLSWIMEVAPIDYDSWSPVNFASDTKLPAAFYSGQNAVVFSSRSDNFAPAVVDGALFADDVIFFGRKGEGSPTLICLRRDAETKSLVQDNPVYADPIMPDSKAAGLKDGEHIIVPARTGGGGFRVRFRREPHRLPLRHVPPAGPRLSLVGLALPMPGRKGLSTSSRRLVEWWFDLKASGQLPEPPFDPYEFTVACERSLLRPVPRLFEWETFRNRGKLREGRSCFPPGGKAKLKAIRLGGPPMAVWDMLVRSESEPFFGYACLEGAAQSSGLNLGIRHCDYTTAAGLQASASRYVVDWLDGCGGFVTEDGLLEGGQAKRSFEKLTDRCFGDETVKLKVVDDQLLITPSSQRGGLPKWVGALNGAHVSLPPGDADELVVADGGEFVFGWYVFRFEGG